jgi:hypothetical protein
MQPMQREGDIDQARLAHGVAARLSTAPRTMTRLDQRPRSTSPVINKQAPLPLEEIAWRDRCLFQCKSVTSDLLSSSPSTKQYAAAFR